MNSLVIITLLSIGMTLGFSCTLLTMKLVNKNS